MNCALRRTWGASDREWARVPARPLKITCFRVGNCIYCICMSDVPYGVRELQAKLGDALRLVKAGNRVVVTSHGKPVAVLTRADMKASQESSVERKLRRMAAQGKIRLGRGGAIRPYRGFPGGGLSEQILKDRR